MQERSKKRHKEAFTLYSAGMAKWPSEGNRYFAGDIAYGSDKEAKAKRPYWAFACLSFIDSVLGFVVHSLSSLIKLMTKTYQIFMSLRSMY